MFGRKRSRGGDPPAASLVAGGVARDGAEASVDVPDRFPDSEVGFDVDGGGMRVVAFTDHVEPDDGAAWRGPSDRSLAAGAPQTRDPDVDDPDSGDPDSGGTDGGDAAVNGPVLETRASRRGSHGRRKRVNPVVVVVAAVVVAALSYGGFHTVWAVYDLGLSVEDARLVLAGQTVALLLLGCAPLLGLLAQERRVRKLAKPVEEAEREVAEAVAAREGTDAELARVVAELGRARDDLAGAVRERDVTAQSLDSLLLTHEDVLGRLAAVEASVAGEAAARRTAEALRDEAVTALNSYLGSAPPDVDAIRAEVAAELGVENQREVAELTRTHEGRVRELEGRLVEARDALGALRDTRVGEDERVAALVAAALGEERSRLRVTVEALAGTDLLGAYGGDGVVAVTDFVRRLRGSWDRLGLEDTGAGGVPGVPARAIKPPVTAPNGVDGDEVKKRKWWRLG